MGNVIQETKGKIDTSIFQEDKKKLMLERLPSKLDVKPSTFRLEQLKKQHENNYFNNNKKITNIRKLDTQKISNFEAMTDEEKQIFLKNLKVSLLQKNGYINKSAIKSPLNIRSAAFIDMMGGKNPLSPTDSESGLKSATSSTFADINNNTNDDDFYLKRGLDISDVNLRQQETKTVPELAEQLRREFYELHGIDPDNIPEQYKEIDEELRKYQYQNEIEIDSEIKTESSTPNSAKPRIDRSFETIDNHLIDKEENEDEDEDRVKDLISNREEEIQKLERQKELEREREREREAQLQENKTERQFDSDLLNPINEQSDDDAFSISEYQEEKEEEEEHEIQESLLASVQKEDAPLLPTQPGLIQEDEKSDVIIPNESIEENESSLSEKLDLESSTETKTETKAMTETEVPIIDSESDIAKIEDNISYLDTQYDNDSEEKVSITSDKDHEELESSNLETYEHTQELQTTETIKLEPEVEQEPKTEQEKDIFIPESHDEKEQQSTLPEEEHIDIDTSYDDESSESPQDITSPIESFTEISQVEYAKSVPIVKFELASKTQPQPEQTKDKKEFENGIEPPTNKPFVMLGRQSSQRKRQTTIETLEIYKPLKKLNEDQSVLPKQRIDEDKIENENENENESLQINFEKSTKERDPSASSYLFDTDISYLSSAILFADEIPEEEKTLSPKKPEPEPIPTTLPGLKPIRLQILEPEDIKEEKEEPVSKETANLKVDTKIESGKELNRTLSPASATSCQIPDTFKLFEDSKYKDSDSISIMTSDSRMSDESMQIEIDEEITKRSNAMDNAWKELSPTSDISNPTIRLSIGGGNVVSRARTSLTPGLVKEISFARNSWETRVASNYSNRTSEEGENLRDSKKLDASILNEIHNAPVQVDLSDIGGEDTDFMVDFGSEKDTTLNSPILKEEPNLNPTSSPTDIKERSPRNKKNLVIQSPTDSNPRSPSGNPPIVIKTNGIIRTPSLTNDNVLNPTRSSSVFSSLGRQDTIPKRSPDVDNYLPERPPKIFENSNDASSIISGGPIQRPSFSSLRPNNSSAKSIRSVDSSKTTGARPSKGFHDLRLGPTKSNLTDMYTSRAPSMFSNFKLTSSARSIVSKNESIAEPRGRERGRLFIRVVGIKDIGLPDIKSHNAKFYLILDNGIHCVNTAKIPLNDDSSVNQEFELTVQDNLEFIVTLKAAYTPQTQTIEVPIDENSTDQPLQRKRTGLSKLFKHRKRRHHKKVKTKKIIKKLADPWEPLIDQDGSFGRVYVDFSKYEESVYAQLGNFEIPCFNEWANFKNDDGSYTIKEAYRIGKMEISMLFYPTTNSHGKIPTSMKLALKQIRLSKAIKSVSYEGYLAQQGGDCTSWKRRYFKLKDLDFMSYSTSSMKPRANINLGKAVQVKHIGTDDDQDELYGPQEFKVIFLNGESINFTAETVAQKVDWINALQLVIGQNAIRTRNLF